MAVPRLHTAVPGLHEAHAPFDEPPRHEELPVLRPLAVHLQDVGRLLADVEGIGRLELHPVGKLEGTDPRLDRRLAGALVEMAGIERAEEVELLLLAVGAEARIADVVDELAGVGLRGVDMRSLEGPREEGAPPVARPPDRHSAGHQRDEAGEVVILLPHAPGQPGAEAGAHLPHVAGVHQHQRHLVVGKLDMHRTDDGELVGVAGKVRKEIADRDAALAVPGEGERGGEGHAGLALGLEVVIGERLAAAGLELRLRVERVDLRHAAVQKHVDHPLRPGGEVGGEGAGHAIASEQAGERDRSEAHAAGAEEIPAGSVHGNDVRWLMATGPTVCPGQVMVCTDGQSTK